MPLIPGTRLGSYEITAPLGAGGMGEVYRARDTKLGREVAVKVLPDALASDLDRVARFEREAKVLAALNHPHIAALYGMEQSDHAGQIVTFLAMELVEGETLAERLQRGAMPVEEVIRVALQIAEGVEAAHEKGVVHRDLKPANVKIGADDRVKVLDFGLAKAMERDVSGISNVTHSPTLSMMATQAGLILGTAAYMSPEQAKGFPADHRSDVFSFGVVLFEMLSGRQPFQGETAPDVLASVLARDVEFATLPSNLNPRLLDLVKRCLEKQPRKRWQAIGDVRAELETIAANPHALPATTTQIVAAPKRPLWQRAIPIAATALVVGTIGAAIGRYVTPPPPGLVTRFAISLPETQTFTNGGRQLVAISPDGTQIAYVANLRLFLRSMWDNEARAIPGSDTVGAVLNPVFSPDGKSIAFWAGGDQTLKRIATTGGTPVTICGVPSVSGLNWQGDVILIGQGGGGIMRVSANGGKPETIARAESTELASSPQLLPSGDAVMFTLSKGTQTGEDRWDRAQILVQSLKTGARTVVVDGGADGRYLSTGHLVYARGGVLFAAPFDLNTLKLSRAPASIVEGVLRGTPTGTAHWSMSSDGTLVFLPGPATLSGGDFDIALMDLKANAIRPLKLRPGSYESPRLSRDGRFLAFSSDDGKEAIVWIYEISGATSMRRLTLGGRNRFPLWSPDGLRVAFQSDREGDAGIFWQRADGTGSAERLTKAADGESHVPESWSPDGQYVLFALRKGNTASLWMYSMPDRRTSPFGDVKSGYPQLGATFSPDGRLVAYSSNDNAARSARVYVQPFPINGTKYEISAAPTAIHPAWSADGKQLFFGAGPGRFGVVPIVTQPSFAFGNLVSSPIAFSEAGPSGTRPLDIARTGTAVALVRAGAVDSGLYKRLEVVLNWREELKLRVPTR